MLSKVRISDLKRQTEIAVMISDRGGYYTKCELADKFNIDASRIHRDIGELRKMGIDIHSRKGRYEMNSGGPVLSRLMRWYVALVETDALTDIHPVHSARTHAQVVSLNRAIQLKQPVQILYNGDWKEVMPLGIQYDESRQYVLLVRHRNEKLKFPVNDIKNLRLSMHLPASELPDLNQNKAPHAHY